MTFAQALPAWCGPDGLPRSWKHFVYGLAFIGRAALRQQAADAQAARIAQVSADDFREYIHDVHRLTETPRR